MIRILPILLALSCCLTGAAFSGRDHKRISRNAIKNIAPAIGKLLKPHAKLIEHQTPAPDFFKRKNESFHHVWHPRGNFGGNIKRVVKLAAELVRELRPVMQQGQKLKASTARRLAHLAHYVQDLCQPLHTAQGKDERQYHRKYEDKWQDTDIKKVLTFRGKIKRITDITRWHKANGKWSNQFYKEVAADYWDDKQFNRKRTFEIYRASFSRAHRSTIEIWTTVFYLASLKKKK